MKNRQRERKTERKKKRKKERKKEYWDKTVTKEVIKYIYIKVKHYIYIYMLCTYQQVFALDWEMTRQINRRKHTGNKRLSERKKDRQRDWKKDRMKERKKERWDKTLTDSVIKYMYITLYTTFTSTCYILTNKCLHLIENN